MALTLVLACANVHTLSTQRVAVVLVSLARIHLKLANAASPAFRARALKSVNHIRAGATIHTWRRTTFVWINLAVVATVSKSAHTAVGERMVKACTAVKAGYG